MIFAKLSATAAPIFSQVFFVLLEVFHCSLRAMLSSVLALLVGGRYLKEGNASRCFGNGEGHVPIVWHSDLPMT